MCTQEEIHYTAVRVYNESEGLPKNTVTVSFMDCQKEILLVTGLREFFHYSNVHMHGQ